MNILQAIILSIVEGLTEFLPVSSTGHMIICSTLMGIQNDKFTKLFEVVIQFGAILSVVVLYRERFFKSIDFYVKLLLAFLPIAIIGLLFHHKIKEMLGDIRIVAFSLFIGGVILLFVDKWFAKNEEEDTDKEVDYFKAIRIGFFQCIALIPGVSRSAATIIGGLTQGLKRKHAAEFAFLLAVPTMAAATMKDAWDERDLIAHSNYSLLLLGSVIAFLVAMAAIKFFVEFLSKHGFKAFGYYRIAVGLLILALIYVFKVDLTLPL